MASDKRAALRVAEQRRKDTASLIAEKVAERDVVEDLISTKKGRDPHNVERRAELHAEIQALIADLGALDARLVELRGRRKKLTRKVKKLTRQIRNSISPKYVDLAFDKQAVRGLAVQGQINGSVGHYTAGPLDDTDEEAFELWRRYDAAHKAQGWSCIGYSIGITRSGTIVRLRGVEYVGAHTLNFNTGQVGISVHGTTGDTWTPLQRRGLKAALKKFGLDGKPVIGHWQAPGQSTACPGSFLRGYITKGKEQ